MSELGHVPAAISRGGSGEPEWPDGLVGSITHCSGYRAAAVAMKSEVWTIGIDAEPHDPLPDGVASMVAIPGERAKLDELTMRWPRTHWYTILFCIKEAVYKAWFPLEREWLGFDQVSVDIDESGKFRATLSRPWTLGDAQSDAIEGRWAVEDGRIKAAIAVRRAEKCDGSHGTGGAAAKTYPMVACAKSLFAISMAIEE